MARAPDVARVRSFRAEYEDPSGEGVGIAFDVTYLLQTLDDRPKIFGFIAGDEMAAYRRRGLVDVQGRPA